MPRNASKRLWTGEPGAGAGHEWLAPRRPEHPPPAPREEPAPPAAPPPGIRRRTLAGMAVGGGVVAAAAVAAVLLVANAFDRGQVQDDVLPAAPPVSGPTAPAAAVYARVSASVVSVRAAQAGGIATGTGFVVGDDGTIVTNSHVVQGSGQVVVRFGDGGPRLSAEVLGRDPSSDLAVLRVDPGAAGVLKPLRLADSDRVRVGEPAIAIGNPFGLDRTATAGIVSGTRREIRAPNGVRIDRVIQTDAPINPGNSGGPLLNAAGQVIGVNSQIATAGARGNVGVGFAVPSNTVRRVVPLLERRGGGTP